MFPDSRLTQRGEAFLVCLFPMLDTSSTLNQTLNICFLSITDTKFQHQKVASSSEILRVLPALSYAEGKVENTHIQPREDLCGLIVLHMQNYSALVHPGSAEGPSQEIKVFPDIDVHVQKHPYLSPECTFQAWKSLKSYLKTPVLFQLPVSKATEILLDDKVGIEEEHDVFALPSSEQTEPNHVKLMPVELLTGQKSAVHLETTLDNSGEGQSDSTDAVQSASANFRQVQTETDTEKTVLSRMIKTVNRSKRTPVPSTSDLHPTELIVSFTSAESAVAEESGINDELSPFSSDKVKAMDDQTVSPKTSSEDNGLNFATTSQSNELKARTKGQKRGSRTCDETSSVQVNDDRWTNGKESCGSGRTMLNKLRNTQSRKVQKNTLKKLLKNKEIRYFYACQKEKRTNLGQKSFGTSMNLSHPQKKMERWDLKPVVSECGRILVPHGHCESDRRKALNDTVFSTIAEATPQRKQLEVLRSTNETSELNPKPIVAEEEAAITGTEATMHKEGEYHSKNTVRNQGSVDQNVLRDCDDEKDPLTLNSESGDHCIKKTVSFAKTDQENCSLISDKCVTKSNVLFSKLKSVLLRGKRKATTLVLEDTTANIRDTESCFKKNKVDTPSHVLENVKGVSCLQQPSNRDVPMCSVDPHFASALGLTPKQVLSDMCTNEAVDSQQRHEPSDKEPHPDSDKDQIGQNLQQFYPRRGRIKALKKHQSISTEHVKKNCKFFSFFCIFR